MDYKYNLKNCVEYQNLTVSYLEEAQRAILKKFENTSLENKEQQEEVAEIIVQMQNEISKEIENIKQYEFLSFSNFLEEE